LWRPRALGVAFATAVVLGCAAIPAVASAATPGEIEGVVTLATTSQPLEGIEVCALERFEVGGESVYEEVGECVETNKEGKYKLEELPAGPYYVEFFSGGPSPDYATEFYKNVSSLASATAVTVQAGKATEGIDASIEEGGAIEGTITSAASGQPVEEVEVCVLPAAGGEAYGCLLDEEDGHYLIGKLPPGSYKIELLPFEQGYLHPQYYDDALTLAAATSVSVTAGHTTGPDDVALQVGGQIDGVVTNASIEKGPIVGLEVCAESLTREVGCAFTNKSGEYAITGLASGSYRVEFTSEVCELVECKSVYTRQVFNAKSSLAEGDLVSVTAPAATTGIDASLLEKDPAVPTNLDPPSLSGTGEVGDTLTCSQGEWAGNPTSISFAWLRNGTAIGGQTASTYTLQSADAGGTVACLATVSNAAGSAAASSASLAIPAPASKPSKGVAALVGKASVKSKDAVLKLRCKGGTACKGTVELEQKTTVKAGKGKHKTRTRVTKLGSAKFSIAAGAEKTVRIQLTSRGQALLRKAGGKGLKLSLAGRDVDARKLVLKATRK
jgi:hypothetical protein